MVLIDAREAFQKRRPAGIRPLRLPERGMAESARGLEELKRRRKEDTLAVAARLIEQIEELSSFEGRLRAHSEVLDRETSCLLRQLSATLSIDHGPGMGRIRK
ncbi:MAG: hypothetical protein AB1324_01110 [Candidatus Micrarchaeota archaeon]